MLENTFFLDFFRNFRVLWGVLKKYWLEKYMQPFFTPVCKYQNQRVSMIGISQTHGLPFCFNLFLTQWMIAISKRCKPGNFEPLNSQKLSFTNIWGLHSNFFECESFLESNSTDILALHKTKWDDSIDSGNFFYFSIMKAKLPHETIWNNPESTWNHLKSAIL